MTETQRKATDWREGFPLLCWNLYPQRICRPASLFLVCTKTNSVVRANRWKKKCVANVYGAPSMQQDIVEMNNGCTVHLLLPTGSFRQIVTLAGEEAARVVSTERHLVALPLPSRVQVLFITHLHNSTFMFMASFQSVWAFIPILIQRYAVFLPRRVFVWYDFTATWQSCAASAPKQTDCLHILSNLQYSEHWSSPSKQGYKRCNATITILLSVLGNEVRT